MSDVLHVNRNLAIIDFPQASAHYLVGVHILAQQRRSFLCCHRRRSVAGSSTFGFASEEEDKLQQRRLHPQARMHALVQGTIVRIVTQKF